MASLSGRPRRTRPGAAGPQTQAAPCPRPAPQPQQGQPFWPGFPGGARGLACGGRRSRLLGCHLRNHGAPSPRPPAAGTLTEHGHELLGVEVPVAPVGPVAVQRGVLLVVVRGFRPEGVDDPDPAPAPGDGEPESATSASPWAGGAQPWVVPCEVRAWARTQRGVTTGGHPDLSGMCPQHRGRTEYPIIPPSGMTTAQGSRGCGTTNSHCQLLGCPEGA